MPQEQVPGVADAAVQPGGEGLGGADGARAAG